MVFGVLRFWEDFGGLGVLGLLLPWSSRPAGGRLWWWRCSPAPPSCRPSAGPLSPQTLPTGSSVSPAAGKEETITLCQLQGRGETNLRRLHHHTFVLISDEVEVGNYAWIFIPAIHSDGAILDGFDNKGDVDGDGFDHEVYDSLPKGGDIQSGPATWVNLVQVNFCKTLQELSNVFILQLGKLLPLIGHRQLHRCFDHRHLVIKYHHGIQLFSFG